MFARYLSAIGLMFVCQVATAEVLATCGASQGHAYYVPGPLVPTTESGWTEDRISKGSFQLVRSGTDHDIIFTDATGGTLSAKGDGATVTGALDQSGNLLLIVFYPGKSMETYIFWFAVKGERKVTYSQAKYGASVGKHSLLAATCKW